MAKAYIRVPRVNGAPQVPLRVRVVVLDWAHDGNGNPTAHYRLEWAVPAGVGIYETGRREQVGYRDKASQAALWRLSRLFPGTSWEIEGGRINGDRTAGRAEFVAVQAEPDNLPGPVCHACRHPLRGDGLCPQCHADQLADELEG